MLLGQQRSHSLCADVDNVAARSTQALRCLLRASSLSLPWHFQNKLDLATNYDPNPRPTNSD